MVLQNPMLDSASDSARRHVINSVFAVYNEIPAYIDVRELSDLATACGVVLAVEVGYNETSLTLRGSNSCIESLLKALVSRPNAVSIIKNGPATVVLWDDRTKTVVKRTEDEADDPEKGFAMALVKKLYGTRSRFKRMLREKTKVQE